MPKTKNEAHEQTTNLNKVIQWKLHAFSTLRLTNISFHFQIENILLLSLIGSRGFRSCSNHHECVFLFCDLLCVCVVND